MYNPVKIKANKGYKMKIQRAVALRVSNLLIKENISQYELSKRMCTDRSTIKHIIHEEYQSIKFETVVKIADAFGMTIQEWEELKQSRF